MKWIVILLCMLGVQGVMADAAFVDFDLGLIYPQELGGMTCNRVEKYDNAGLGYTVFYKKGDNFSAEISVYTLGRESIASGHAPKETAVIFESVERNLELRQEGGAIAGLRKRGSVVVPKKGSIQFANTVFQYSTFEVAEGLTNSVPRILSTYGAGAHNNLVKVLFNFDVAESKQARPMADRLVNQLVQTIKAGHSEEELLMAACDALIYNPSDYAGRIAARQVFVKAQTMGELNVFTHLFVWPQDYRKPENADLLTAAYFAGMLKVVIPQKLEAGGELEGFIFMLKAYESMRARNDIESIPQLDEWMKADDKQALFDELLLAPEEE
jgi:hypothetical protein